MHNIEVIFRMLLIAFMAACLLLNNAIIEDIENAMTITVEIVKDSLMPS
jgi:hypothetical protein